MTETAGVLVVSSGGGRQIVPSHAELLVEGELGELRDSDTTATATRASLEAGVDHTGEPEKVQQASMVVPSCAFFALRQLVEGFLNLIM